MKINKSGMALEIVVVVICVLMIAALVSIPFVMIDVYKELLEITDRRFDSGYTETIQKDGVSVLITHPPNYELQLDGENWVDVTEIEYSRFRVGEHYRK